jgi:hypothetical protein
MTEVKQSFEVYIGDTKAVTVTVKDEDADILNLTGYTCNWVMYDGDGDIVLTKTLSTGLSVPTPSNGQVVILLEPEDTEDLEPDTYYHELEITSSDGDVSTVTTGYVKVSNSKA